MCSDTLCPCVQVNKGCEKMKHDILQRTCDLVTYKILSLLTLSDRKHILLLLNSKCSCQLSPWGSCIPPQSSTARGQRAGYEYWLCTLLGKDKKARCFLRIPEENLGALSYELWVGKNFPSLSLKPEIIKADRYYYFRKKHLKVLTIYKPENDMCDKL